MIFAHSSELRYLNYSIPVQVCTVAGIVVSPKPLFLMILYELRRIGFLGSVLATAHSFPYHRLCVVFVSDFTATIVEAILCKLR